MTPHLDVAVTEASQVGEARRAVARLAAEHGVDELARGRLAIIVTELGNNLARHAQRGRLLAAATADADGLRFELLSIDGGPGMADVDRCLRDGFSSGATPGTGLGAVRRLSTDFSIFSMPGPGTVILSRLRVAVPAGAAPAPFSYAGICVAAPGETVSGDAWAVRVDGARASALVADGLGHGPGAAEAADTMATIFATASGSPAAILERAHPLLRPTRGAAVALVQLDAAAGSLLVAGAGNIAGRLISGVEDRSLLSQHGTLGVQIRKLQDVAVPWPEHAIVVLHSDGIATRWNLGGAVGLLRCDPAVIAGWILRDHLRGRDDATVVVMKKG